MAEVLLQRCTNVHELDLFDIPCGVAVVEHDKDVVEIYVEGPSARVKIVQRLGVVYVEYRQSTNQVVVGDGNVSAQGDITDTEINAQTFNRNPEHPKHMTIKVPRGLLVESYNVRFLTRN